LAAAIYLGRFRRRALLLDAGRSRAKWISSIRNYPGFPDLISGPQLLGDMHMQAQRFGACIQTGTVSAIERSEDGFVVSASDRKFRAATILIASGVADDLPDVPGFSEELIVRDRVRLCPVCDGYEFIDRTIAVWGEAERSVKEALFLRAYSKSITVLVASGSVGASDRARLAEAGIEVVENPLARLEELESAIAAIDADGRARRYDCIYLAMGSRPRTGLAVRLGPKSTRPAACSWMRINRRHRAVCIRPETSSTNLTRFPSRSGTPRSPPPPSTTGSQSNGAIVCRTRCRHSPAAP
jgi:thioredoxin reductase (NADPH)